MCYRQVMYVLEITHEQSTTFSGQSTTKNRLKFSHFLKFRCYFLFTLQHIPVNNGRHSTSCHFILVKHIVWMLIDIIYTLQK